MSIDIAKLKAAPYQSRFARLWERYDEASHDNAEHMRDILGVTLDALETAERHIFKADRETLELIAALEAKDAQIAELLEKQRLIDICQGQGLEHRIAAEKRAEAAEKRIAELEVRTVTVELPRGYAGPYGSLVYDADAVEAALEAAERQKGYLREQCNEWERKAISNFENCSEMAARIEELESQRKMAFMASNRWADKFREAEKRIAELTEFLLHVKKCLVKNGEYAPLSHEAIDTILNIRADGISLKIEGE